MRTNSLTTAFAATAILAGTADAATVTNVIDFTDTFLVNGADTTIGPLTASDVVFSDGGSNSVTVNIALTANGTTTARVRDNESTIYAANGVRSTWWSNGTTNAQEPIFTVTLVSTTGDVDASTIEFKFDSIRLQQRGVAVDAGELEWTSTSTTTPSGITQAASTTVDQALDTTFTDLDAGNYVGTLDWKTTNSSNGEGYRMRDNGNQLQATLQFALVPEPGSLALLGLGGMLIARRRR